jgi:uncharacterized membrane protein
MPDIAPVPLPEDRLASARRDILGFSAIGAASMAYLMYVHFKPSGSSLCDFGDGFSCDIVNKSVYAEIFGVPVSLLGLVYFAAVFAVAYRKELFAKYVGEVQAATVASLVFGLYLTWVEVFLLGSICVFCELSKIMMVGIIFETVVAARRAGTRQLARFTPAAIGAGALGVLVFRWYTLW